jgi:hypothetical protein
VIQELSQRIRVELGRQGGSTQRRSFPLTEIEPSASLGDTLDFKKNRIRENIRIGYLDLLRVLRSRDELDAFEHEQLANRQIFPV